MRNVLFTIYVCLIGIIVFFIFREWFTAHYLIGGDWRFFWPQNLKEIFSYTHTWDSSFNTGLGFPNPFLSINTYLAIGVYIFNTFLKIPWNITEKIIFFWPIIGFSFFSSFYLSRQITQNRYANILSGVIYLLNSYSLMIFSGGQVGVAFSYSLIPFIFAYEIKFLMGKASPYTGLQFIGVSALLLLLDFRIFYLTVAGFFIYYFVYTFWNVIQEKKSAFGIIKKEVIYFGGIFLVAILLNLFWIIPVIFLPKSIILEAAGFSVGIVRFFSFADFPHAFSLLHPNWPENIFGKVYFMKPEFLVLPLVAFSSLILLKGHVQKKNIPIVVFSIVALIASFLAKGVNEPFGTVYFFLYQYLPGMNLFRDPTKWYMLIVVSYAMLIPLGVIALSNLLTALANRLNRKLIAKYSFFIVFVVINLFYFFLLYPAISGQIRGTFSYHSVPSEYIRLTNFLSNQNIFFRTLWIPSLQRFGYSSNTHPAIGRGEISNKNLNDQLKELHNPKTEALLQSLAVKYIIIPYDSEGEIFLKDRKYNSDMYKSTISKMNDVPWLRKINMFQNIGIYELKDYNPHFSIKNNPTQISSQMINPSSYIVDAVSDSKLIFSEKYDPNWNISNTNPSAQSIKYENIINSFDLQDTSVVSVFYRPEKWMLPGRIISGVTFVGVLIAALYLKFQK